MIVSLLCQHSQPLRYNSKGHYVPVNQNEHPDNGQCVPTYTVKDGVKEEIRKRAKCVC